MLQKGSLVLRPWGAGNYRDCGLGASGSRNLAFTLPRSPQLYHPMTMTMVMAMKMAMGMVVAAFPFAAGS